MYYIFTEDKDSKFGYVGRSYFSEVQAQDKADDFDCITHILQADSLVQAKRKLRSMMVKKKRDIGILFKNVKNKGGV